ncbi:hypothetical protein [Flexivirga caeni]|nr:hypothetical protein [Flexivirga caeni]
MLAVAMPVMVRFGAPRAVRRVVSAGQKWAVVDSDRRGLFRVLVLEEDRLAVYRKGALERSWRWAQIEAVRCAVVTGAVKTRPFSGFEVAIWGHRPAKFYVLSSWNAWGVDRSRAEQIVAAIQEARAQASRA